MIFFPQVTVWRIGYVEVKSGRDRLKYEFLAEHTRFESDQIRSEFTSKSICAHKMFKVGMQWGMSWFEGTSSQKPSFKLLTIFLMFCKCAVPSGSKGTCNTLFQPETGETNLTCVPLFSFACGGRVLVVPRGVSDTCHVSQVSPWVTTSPPPFFCPMWESQICGRQHQYLGVSDKWDWALAGHMARS